MGVNLDIPDLHLGNKYITESPPPSSPVSSTGADTSGPSSRRTSISSGGRPASGRSGSASSSRSTSFSLPRDSTRERVGSKEDAGEEVEEGEEMDPEGELTQNPRVDVGLLIVGSCGETCCVCEGTGKTLFW